MNLKTMMTFMGVTIGILVGVGALLWQFGSGAAKPLDDVAGEMRLKRGEGSVVVVEFSDFQCPACASIHQPLKQSEWEGLSNPTEAYVAYAKELGMDTSKFESDLKSSEVAERVSTDMIYANRNALSGTPTFFVNGAKVDFTNLETRLLELTK